MTRIRYQTSYSIWEVDWLQLRVRRLSGLNEATPLTPVDGDWRMVQSVVDLPEDEGLFIIWVGEDNKYTYTSPVVDRVEVRGEDTLA